MPKPTCLYISGIASCGKSSLCQVITQYYSSDLKKLSFATPLREELKEFVKNNFNLNIYTQDPIEKSLIRPLMISYANIRRKQTDGRYFIDKLKIKIKNIKNEYVVVDDLRFKEYNYDELDFCKETGIVIHVKKYFLNNKGYGHILKEYQRPPNEFEAKNDPLIDRAADYHIDWKECDNKSLLIKDLYSQSRYVLDQIFL